MMRWWIALAAAIVLAGGFLVWKSILVAGVQRDFATLGHISPSEGFGTELPKELESRAVLSDLLQSFQIPIVIFLIVISFGAAFVWPKASKGESMPAQADKRDE